MTAVARQEPEPQPSICVGISASDPLRSIGLQAIVQENLHLRATLFGESGAKSAPPDVVIVDLCLQDSELLGESVERMRRLLPGVPVVVLARSDNPDALQQAMASGALGFLPETAGVDEIHGCLLSVLEGVPWLPLQTARVALLSDSVAEPEMSLSSRFTPKEREVLRWLTQGRSNREIAQTMHIDEATVKAHLGRMLRKAKATNRVELTLRVLAERS